MSLISAIGTVLKGKVLVTAIVGATFLVGTGVALAATSPGGRDLVEHMTGVHATATHTHDTKASPTAKGTEDSDKDDSKSCPGQPEAQQLATKFSLSTASNSSSMKVICTLHDGTFQGTDHALGYGEIDQLLTFAQSLAKKANTNLSDSNVQTFVATALKDCGSTPVTVCVNNNVPDNHSSGSGHDGGKPTATPTSHGNGGPTNPPTPRAH